MIGVFDYTVLLTYASVILSGFGMLFAFSGRLSLATLMLVLCGLCDLFDGPVARTKKNRTEDEKQFGIQIDSFSDLISFGVFPAVMGFALSSDIREGFTPEKIIFLLFPLCGLIRLAHFNVMETKRQQETPEKLKYYTGVPITTSAIVFPILYLTRNLVSANVYYVFYLVTMAILGILFILKIKIRKPGKYGWIFFVVMAAVALVFYFIGLI